MKRSATSVFANPVLVGAITLLVVIVAVFLSYNANQGLPFVPTTALKVRFANGANLVPGNEIRSGGFRVGVVEDMKPVQLRKGKVGSELKLKIDKRIGEIPRDSTWVIRPRSALGLKYLELTEGRSSKAFRNGDTVGVAQTTVPVDLDEVFQLFDKKTREANQTNLRGFGDTFAGRGSALGRTVEELPRLFGYLEPVARNLADPDTQLDNFFKELGDTVRVLRPVSDTQAALFTSMADTFEALARDEQALKDFISKQPPFYDAAVESFRVQRPFLRDLTGFSKDFEGATRELRGALPIINPALETGTRVQRRAPQLNRELAGTFTALQEPTSAPTTNAALRALTATVTTLNPQIRFYGPYVTVCNGPNYFFTYLAEHFSEPDSTGSSQRALANTTPRQKNSIGSMGATEPANGEELREGNAAFLQGQAYVAAVAPDGRADCEAGQRGYLERNARFQDKKFRTNQDPRTPGLQGPTFTGRERVPEGQTFTAVPETGPYKDIPESEVGGR